MKTINEFLNALKELISDLAGDSSNQNKVQLIPIPVRARESKLPQDSNH